MSTQRKLFLLDAYALVYRSYYAFMRAPMFNSKGFNTSTVYGFATVLEEVLRNQKPTHVAVVFDPPGNTFRDALFTEYKANREETPEEIRKSVPIVKELIQAFQVPVIEVPGYEADDVIGTLAKKAATEGFEVYMMTSDKDYAQLIAPGISMYKPAKAGKEAEVISLENIREAYGVENPVQYIDVLALWGDASDNIPGVPGIGEKTALKLVNQYGNIEGIYEHLHELTPKTRESLSVSRETLSLARQLVRIVTDVEIPLEVQSLAYLGPDKEKIEVLFREMNFTTLANRVLGKTSPEKPSAPRQATLFDMATIPVKEDINPTRSIQDVPHHYVLVDSEQDWLSLVRELENVKEFCFDTETTSLDVHGCELVGIAFSWKAHEGYFLYLPAARDEATRWLQRSAHVFLDTNIAKCGQNMKFDLLVLKQYGIEVKGNFFDTMIAHYLLQPEQRHNMNFLAEKYLQYTPVPIEDLIGQKGKGQSSMRQVAPGVIAEYAAEDADITWQLREILYKELENNNMMPLFSELEMPLVQVLVEMESNGFAIEGDTIQSFSKGLIEDILALEKEIYLLAGHEFNISSPKQLGEILFDRLKISDNARKTKTKQYSTNEEVLQALADKHEIIPKILEYRGLKKLLNTYVETLPKLINPKTGRVHTSFNQTVAATGRLASSDPNLQNIPIREARGRELRKAFIPGSKENVLLAADYSQIELRVMAHLSKDANMISAFQADEDIHQSTAAKIFHVEPGEVTREMRGKAKTANFGIIYGISVFGLSQRLSIPRAEAQALIDGYFRTFPGVREYMNEQIQRARDRGYVETILGRRRFLPDIHSANATVRGYAERNAINAPIQGSAADIIKRAMIDIHREMQGRTRKAKLILQVHDELVFDVPRDELDELTLLVRRCMENAIHLDVPLKVDSGVGVHWLDAH